LIEVSISAIITNLNEKSTSNAIPLLQNNPSRQFEYPMFQSSNVLHSSYTTTKRFGEFQSSIVVVDLENKVRVQDG